MVLRNVSLGDFTVYTYLDGAGQSFSVALDAIRRYSKHMTSEAAPGLTQHTVSLISRM